MKETELKEAVRQRQTQRVQREKSEIPIVAFVGYTNSGKSTLLNRFLELGNKDEKKVLAKDMLFATLETATRSIELSDKKKFLVTDTVGFVDQLPHHLIKAFRSTLEEVKDADLLLHIVDASSSTFPTQIEVTNRVLADIGVKDIPMVYVYNKIDQADEGIEVRDPYIKISALYDENLDQVISIIKQQLFADHRHCKMLIPYEKGNVFAYLKTNATMLSSVEQEDGYLIEVELSPKDYALYQSYIV